MCIDCAKKLIRPKEISDKEWDSYLDFYIKNVKHRDLVDDPIIWNEPMRRMIEQQLADDLIFQELKGEVHFYCKESSKVFGSKYINYVTIPQEISLKGEAVISWFVHKNIKEAIVKCWRHEAVKKYIREKHLYIETNYKDGTPLEGRITSASSELITVKLDIPFKGESGIRFTFDSVAKGYFVFNEDDNISFSGFNAACVALGWAYEDALKRPQICLTKNLYKNLNN